MKQEPGELINLIDLYDLKLYGFTSLIKCSLSFYKMFLLFTQMRGSVPQYKHKMEDSRLFSGDLSFLTFLTM